MRSWPFLLPFLLACTKPAPVVNAAADSGAASPPSAAPPPTPPATPRIVREEITVVVGGGAERWRLEWRKPPTPQCMDESWSTCPCDGIEFGEEGELDLVREREGAAEERLHLDALFMNHTAALPRWQKLPSDSADAAPTPATLRARPLVRIMQLADYDHDGMATEFVLRVGYEMCGHVPTLVVGVSTSNPALHAFTAVENPKEPLLLESAAQWEQIRRSLPATLSGIRCGDHGSEVARTTRITRDAAGLHAKTTETRCPGQ